MTNAPCPVPNPSLGDEYLRTQQLPTLFSVPSSELQISQTQDLKRLLFKRKYWCSPFELPSIKAAVTPPRCPLKSPWKSHTLAWELEQISRLQKSPLPRSLPSSRLTSPPLTGFTYDSEEDVGGFEGLLHPRRVLLRRR